MRPRSAAAVAAAFLLGSASSATLLAQTTGSTALTVPATNAAATRVAANAVKAEIRGRFSELLDLTVEKVFQDLRASLGLPPAGGDPTDPLAMTESFLQNAITTWASQVGDD